MEQDGFKIEIRENGEHILVHCSDKAKNKRGIIEIREDVTNIARNAFHDIYDTFTLSIPSYSLVPALLNSLNGWKGCYPNSRVKIYDPILHGTISKDSLAMLYKIYPTAFEVSQDGKCFFDKCLLLYDNHTLIRWLDEKRIIVLACPSDREEIPYSVSLKVEEIPDIDSLKMGSITCYYRNQDSITNSWPGGLGEGWNDVKEATYSVDAFVRLDPYYSFYSDDPSSNVVPSISTIIIDGGRRLDKLTFTGPLPKHIYLGKDIKVNNLYINEPKNDVMRHPAYASLRSAVEGSVFYAAPSLCDEESINPGYIRLTESHRLKYRDEEDKIIEINTFFIASVEPYEIDCYSPVVGTLLSLAIDDKSERKYEYLVYEPMDVVQKKIRESLARIDDKYLAFQVASWNKYKEGK